MTDTTRSLTQEPLLLADLSSPETRDLLPRIELVLAAGRSPRAARAEHRRLDRHDQRRCVVPGRRRTGRAGGGRGPRRPLGRLLAPPALRRHHRPPPIHPDCRAGGHRRLALCARLAPLPGGQRPWRQHRGHHHRDRADQARHGCALDRLRVRLCLDRRAGEDAPACRGDRSWRRRRGGSGDGRRAAPGQAVRLRRTAADGRQVETAALLRAYGGSLARRYDEVTHNGATGDATSASAEIGQQILDGAARRLAEIIEVMLREADAAEATQAE